jgi:cell wall-associated NlpC family hydrolase
MRRSIHLAHLALFAGAVFSFAAGAAAQSAAVMPRHIQVRGIVDGVTIVATARRYLGVRYVLGGTTPRAFDCSGFVRYVFQVHGLDFPRTAHEQSALGHRPASGDLQPGDLLFFYGGEGAQHIAIYVGNDSIIHASSGGKRVKIDKLAGTGMRRSWFGQRLIAVRRLLPAEGVFQLPGELALSSSFAAAVEDPAWIPSTPSLF